MTHAALAAALASGLASAALGLRSMILRKDIKTRPTAPWSVTFSLMLVCAVLGGVSFSIWHTGQASWREVWAYGGLAAGALVLLVNLVRQKRAAT